MGKAKQSGMDDASLVVESAHNVKKEKSNIKDELNTDSVKLLVFFSKSDR